MTDSDASDDPREREVLDAMQRCFERWGPLKTTLDDIAQESGISRASLYRMFPGGRRVMIEAFRVEQRSKMSSMVQTLADHYRSNNADATPHGFLARFVSLAVQRFQIRGSFFELAAEPEIVADSRRALPLTIKALADALTKPLSDDLPLDDAQQLADLVVRLMISHIVTPSDHVDLTDEQHALRLLEPIIPVAHRATRVSEKE